MKTSPMPTYEKVKWKLSTGNWQSPPKIAPKKPLEKILSNTNGIWQSAPKINRKLHLKKHWKKS
jgi:hypothetical protein